MEKKIKNYFDFIRYAICSDINLAISTDMLNWHGLYHFSCKQTIAGAVFEGLKGNGEKGVKPPLKLLMEWIGVAEQIAARNMLLNNECKRLTELFESEGHKTAILKGQANARLYTNPLCRQSGDIDIYVDGGEKKVLETLCRIGMIKNYKIGEYEGEGNASKVYHHVHIPTNNQGVEVEVHFRPSSGVWNPFSNRRIQFFLENEIGKGCEMVEEGFRVPSLRFALIMQMAHMQKHFMDEGVGLRQMMDYYFLLKSENNNQIQVSEFKIQGYTKNMEETLKYLGLYKFASAVMWILKEQLGLDEGLLIVPPDEWRGKFLLSEVIRGGNFGKNSVERRVNGFGRLFMGRLRHMRLLRFDYKETIWFELKYWKMQIGKTFVRIKRGSWTVR